MAPEPIGRSAAPRCTFALYAVRWMHNALVVVRAATTKIPSRTQERTIGSWARKETRVSSFFLFRSKLILYEQRYQIFHFVPRIDRATP